MNNNSKALPLLLTSDTLPSGVLPTEVGSVLFVTHIEASNVVRDIKENIRNIVGGRMQHYERLINNTTELALEKMRLRLHNEGWHGALSVRISHPNVVEGGCEVLVYGTPYRRYTEQRDQ